MFHVFARSHLVASLLFSLAVASVFSTINSAHAATIEGDIDLDFREALGYQKPPNAAVSAFGVQSDGRVLVGGSFTAEDGTSRGIARLSSDGTFDESFALNTANGISTSASVVGIAVAPNDDAYLVGSFTSYAGATSNRIVRINADGSRDAGFAVGTGFNNAVQSVALQADGKVLAGGSFTSYKGTTYNRIIRINDDGTADATFATNIGTAVSDGTVLKVGTVSDGDVIVSGTFTTFNGASIQNFVRLNSDGTVDTSFMGNLGTGFNATVYDYVELPDGDILIVGSFTTVNGVTRNRIVVLNSDGTVDTDKTAVFGTGTTTYITDVEQDADGYIYISGNFTSVNGITRSKFARFNPDLTDDATFYANGGAAETGPNDIAIVDDYIYIASPGKIGGVELSTVARLNIDGTIDPTFFLNYGLGADNSILQFKPYGSGFVVSGVFEGFSTLDGWKTPNGYAIFDENYNYDDAFAANAGSGFNSGSSVGGVLTFPDGDILMYGSFATFDGVSRGRIIRFNSDGTLDTAFMGNVGTGASGIVSAAVELDDGDLLFGGSFTSFGASTPDRIVRLNSDGTVDTAFMANMGSGFTGPLYAFLEQADGKIVVGGSYTSFNGATHNRLVRFNADGTLDTAFATAIGTGFGSDVRDVVQTSDGDLVVVGVFTTFNGATYNRIVRLNSDGTVDTAFMTTVGTASGGLIMDVELGPDGDIHLGGAFTNFGPSGGSNDYYVRLNNDGTEDATYVAQNKGEFNSSLNNNISSVYVDPTDGSVVLTGSVMRYVDTYRVGNIVRLYGSEAPIPDQPAAPDLIDGADTGYSIVDNLTSDNMPTFAGVASSTASIRLYDENDVLRGTATADGSGDYEVTSSAVSDGIHQFVVTQTLDGQVSATSSAATITVDTADPTLTAFYSTSTNRTYGLGENVAVIARFSERIGNDSTMSVTLDTGDILTLVATSGPSSLLRGSYIVSEGDSSSDLDVVAINSALFSDYAGNATTSTAAPGTSLAQNAAIAISTVAPTPMTPAVPNLDTASDSGISTTDNLTNDATPTFSGTASSSATVYLYANDVEVGSVAADGAGAYSITSSSLTDGTYSMTLVQEVSGALSATSTALSVEIDTAPPTLTAFTSTSSNRTYEEGEYVSVVARFSERVAATTTLEISLDVGQDIVLVATSSASVTTYGTYLVAEGEVSNDLDVVSINSMEAYDRAGNITTATSLPVTNLADSKDIVIDAVVIETPPTLAAPDLVTASDTGISSVDNLTNDATPTFSGTASSSATVYLYANEVLVGTTIASAGSYTITASTLSEGTYNFAVVQATSSVQSATSSNTVVVIDTTSPNLELIYSTTTNGTYTAGGQILFFMRFDGVVTNSSTATLELDTGDTVSMNATSSATTLLRGTYTVGYGDESDDLDVIDIDSIAVSDAAGNTTILSVLPSPYFATFHDIVVAGGSAPVVVARPSAPNLDTASDSGISTTDNLTNDATPTFSGTASSSATVYLYANDVEVGSAVVSVGGSYSVTSSLLDEGQHVFTLVQATSSTRSATSTSLTVSIDTTAPNIAALYSTTPDGTYDVDDSISVFARLSEVVDPASEVRVLFDTGRYATLTASSGPSTLLLGTYDVQANDETDDLNVGGLSNVMFVDWAGNESNSTTLPISNIADTSDIVIDTAIDPDPDPDPDPEVEEDEDEGGRRKPGRRRVFATTTESFSPSVVIVFTRDLDVGSTGEDVRELQRFLNAAGFVVAPTGPGSVGQETTMFGAATRAALGRYQAARGIVPASGYFGPTTRMVVNTEAL